MGDPADKARLEALEKRIEAAKGAKAPRSQTGEKLGQANHAWRMVIELVVGIAIGVGIGYGLDVLFGTMPWFLVPFTLLGFAAGIRTMLRTAQELQDDNAAAQAATNEDEGE